jgi:O-methyltransferase
MSIFNRLKDRFTDAHKNQNYRRIHQEFREYSMIPQKYYINNLILADIYRKVDGAVVECGVWRGGMIAGIAKLFSDNRDYYLFDSFEGLPPAKDIDGQDVIRRQNNKNDPKHHGNYKAEIEFAEQAMKVSGIKNYHLRKGWFKDTLPEFKPSAKIAILRLDGDLYESTMDCLNHLYPLLADDGIIIIDDYYYWEGCTRAVHEYLSKYQSVSCIKQFDNSICYITKKVSQN